MARKEAVKFRAKGVNLQQEQRDAEWCPSPYVDARMSHTLQVWSYGTPSRLPEESVSVFR